MQEASGSFLFEIDKEHRHSKEYKNIAQILLKDHIRNDQQNKIAYKNKADFDQQMADRSL